MRALNLSSWPVLRYFFRDTHFASMRWLSGASLGLQNLSVPLSRLTCISRHIALIQDCLLSLSIASLNEISRGFVLEQPSCVKELLIGGAQSLSYALSRHPPS